MSAKGDGGDFDGTVGHPQLRMDLSAPAPAARPAPTYEPSPKHDPRHAWDKASVNPILTSEEGQRLLETGFRYGKQVYNVTERGEIVVYQPANTPNAAYHSYGTEERSNLPVQVLRWLRDSGHISSSEYKKLVNNKPRRGRKRK